jgi:hypothetical protein
MFVAYKNLQSKHLVNHLGNEVVVVMIPILDLGTMLPSAKDYNIESRRGIQ